MDYGELIDPRGRGVKIIPDFAEPEAIDSVVKEADGVDWFDAHEVYTNQRGLEIIQNHDTFALKLSAGDQSPLNQLPATVALKHDTECFIQGLSTVFPSLLNWQADELSFHLYDDQEVGLSRHRDNKRFIGLVAIISLEGECDLVISHQGQSEAHRVVAGDLCLLRAPGLIESDQEVRPEHSVQNLGTQTRLSMMLRANNKPTEAIEGFRFNNWQPEV